MTQGRDLCLPWHIVRINSVSKLYTKWGKQNCPSFERLPVYLKMRSLDQVSDTLVNELLRPTILGVNGV